MSFRLKILGANSATPAYGRHQTSQLLQVENCYFLIDCGEGCQMQLMRYKERISKIQCIFISHLHGDHFYGLIGLLNTMSMGGRKQSLDLYGPPDLAEVITALLRCSRTVLSFHIHFHALSFREPVKIFENNLLTVTSIPMEHGTLCAGFLFREKPKPYRINKEFLPEDVTVPEILYLKEGKDLYDAEGKLRYRHSALTLPPRKIRSYAYCSDTRYQEKVIPHIQGVDLLYHEATFMQDQSARAASRFHSTTVDAATIAKKAAVGQLIVGHYSSRYKVLEPLLAEAKRIFPNTVLAIEGQDYLLEE